MFLAVSIPYAQQTFSKILDIQETEQEFGTHIRLMDGHIFGFGTHFCPTATIEDRVCASISKLNFDGDFLELNFLEGYENYRGPVSLLEEDSILFMAFDHDINKHGISLAKFYDQNSQFSTFNIGLHNNRRFVAEGIQEFNNAYYTYGHFDDLTPGVRIKGFVKKWNKDFSKELASWTFEHNDFLTLSDLRFTQDSTIVFSLYENRPGPGDGISVHLIQIDTIGNRINDISIEYASAGRSNELNLELDAQDFAYLSYEKFGQRLAKIDIKKDTVMWELEFPSDIHHLARNYDINELIIAKNGDLVVCGNISYRHFVDGEILDVVYSGFVSRISDEGGIIWTKILTNEITQPSTLLFAESYLNDIIELPNGNLVSIGQIADLGFEGLNQEIWIVSLTEDGCFKDFDCDHDIYVLNGEESFPILSSTKELPSLIEQSIRPNPVQDKLYLDTPDQNWQYQIINLQGQQMMQGKYQDYIKVETLTSGIYFLQLEQDGIYYKAIKFVKE